MAAKMRYPVQVWIMSNPCFYLFAALLLLLILLPAFEHSERGKLWFTAMNLPVLVSSAVVLGRSRWAFWAAVPLASAAFVLLLTDHVTGSLESLVWSWRFSIATLLITLVHLVHYVLQPAGADGMTADRLYGGPAAYLLLGLLWCYFYAICEHHWPGSFAGLGPPHVLHIADLVFLSFGSLTTVGGADLVPQGKAARTLVILEAVAGTLYMGAFVARLVGMYSGGRR